MSDGLCECGCGKKTNLARQTEPRFGWVKGQPVRFLPNHHRRKWVNSWVEEDHGYETPCRIWQRSLNNKGYGVITGGKRKMKLAHRLVYEWVRGPIPEGMVIDHLCGTPACVRLEHLECVTQLENMRRYWASRKQAA